MTFDRAQIRIPTKQNGAVARVRFVILLLDIITVVFLCLTIGLRTCWTKEQCYEWANWNDPLVLGVVGISLIWTCFLHVRPAFRKTPVHPGHYVAWELICWLFISGCTAPALVMSPLLEVGAESYSYSDEKCRYGVSELSHNSRECPRMAFLTMLELLAYSIALLLS